jgi:hypothetical protein
MNGGVFNTGIEWWQLLFLIIGSALSIVVVKIAISFDVNKFLERRDTNNLTKLRNACPHFMIGAVENNQFEVRSLYYKPAGTFNHVCRQCGLVNHLDIEQHERDANYYIKNPGALIERQEKLAKLAKKFGKVAKK